VARSRVITKMSDAIVCTEVRIRVPHFDLGSSKMSPVYISHAQKWDRHFVR
jgi:hypothetical protein